MERLDASPTINSMHQHKISSSLFMKCSVQQLKITYSNPISLHQYIQYTTDDTKLIIIVQ